MLEVVNNLNQGEIIGISNTLTFFPLDIITISRILYRIGIYPIYSELPIMEHCSGVRYICACNCGRCQGPREDPFSLRQANYDYFQMLAKQCGCAQLESIQFPIFQPSTHNFR